MAGAQGDRPAPGRGGSGAPGAAGQPGPGGRAAAGATGADGGGLGARAGRAARGQLEFLREHLAFMLMTPAMLWGPFVIRVMEEGPAPVFTAMYVTEAVTAVLLAAVLSRAGFGAGRRRRTGRASAPAGPAPGAARPALGEAARHVSPACWASAAVLGLAPLGHYLLAATGDVSFIMASAILGSAGRAWFFALSIQLYARMPVMESLRCVVWSYLLAVPARAVLDLPPIGAVLPAICLMPLALALMLGRARALLEGGPDAPGGAAGGAREADGRSPGPRRARQAPSRRMLVTLVLEAAFFGLVIGAYRLNSGIWQSSVGYDLLGLLLKAAMLVVMLLLLDAWGERIRAYTLSQVALVLVVAAVTAITLAYQTGGGLVLAALLTDLARYAVELALYLTALLLASRFSVRPATALALCLTPFCATVAAMYSLSISPGASGGYGSPLVVNVAMIGVAAACIFANAASDSEERLFSTGPWRQPADSDRIALLEEACERVGAEHGLTPREVEILQLVCRGRSKRYIAEHLALSENTVRWHAKNLYAKLGVNSREELLDLVDAM